MSTPQTRAYDLQVATARVALDVIYEPADTPSHTSRLALAWLALRTGGDRLPLHLATVAEAHGWDTTLTWATVTRPQLRAAISAVWTDVALSKFPEVSP